MRVRGVLLVMALSLPVAAQAQDRKWVGEIGVGPTFLFGTAGDHLGAGFNFQAGVIYKVNRKFGIKLDTLVSKHDVKDEITQALGVGDGNGWLWHFSGNGMVTSDPDKKASLYGIGGLGVYYRKIELTNPSAAFVTVCDPWLGICYPVLVPADQIVGSYSSTNIGINFGGGVNVRLNDKMSAFVETRFHYVWGDKPAATVNPLTGSPTQNSNGNGNTQFMPIVFGIRF